MRQQLWHDDTSFGGLTPVVKKILIATCLLFIVQMFVDQLFVVEIEGRQDMGLFTYLFGLSWPGIRHFMVWQVATYVMVHGGFLHIILNMFMLFMFGPQTERILGGRRFATLYLLSGVAGALGWLASTRSGVPCVGASGSIFGVLCAFAALFPNRTMYIIPIPIPIRAWVLALSLMVIQLMYMLSSLSGNIAYAAHLGGGLAGALYALRVARPGTLAGFYHRWRMKSKMRVLKQEREAVANESAKVDDILEKIARDGIESLSRSERALLEKRSGKGRG